MRKVEANIRKLKFKNVKIALREAGFSTFTYWAVRSISEASDMENFDEGDYPVASERVKFSIVVKEKEVDKVIDTIVGAGKTLEVDDARIYVYPVLQAYKIAGRENGDLKIHKV